MHSKDVDAIVPSFHRPELRDSLVAGEAKIRQLMEGTAIQLAAGQVLIRAGADHEYVYLLRSGWACRSRLVADGRDQYILAFLPGELFAIKSMFVPRHPDSILALSDAVLDRVHFKKLFAAYGSDADVANRCIWQVVEEERRLHGSVFALGQASAEERLAYLIMDFRGRLITLGAIASPAVSFPFPLTQEQLGGFIGITAIHVNRLLRTFREREIAQIRGGQITIMEFGQLRAIASPLLDLYEQSSAAYAAALDPRK